MNYIDFIISFESGECTDEEIIDGIQAMIDDGTVWCLQGSYVRIARSLIEQGHCHA